MAYLIRVGVLGSLFIQESFSWPNLEEIVKINDSHIVLKDIHGKSRTINTKNNFGMFD